MVDRGEQDAARTQHIEGPLAEALADDVEDDVDVAHGLGEVDGAVVDDLVGPELAYERCLPSLAVVMTCAPRALASWICHVADAAAAAVDEDALAGLDVREVDQALPRGEADQGECCRLYVVDGGGLRASSAAAAATHSA